MKYSPSLIRALGWRSVARVGLYRLGLRTGLHPVLRIKAETPTGPFFRGDTASDEPPSFNANPLTGERWPGAALPWHKIPDFAGTDIKLVWELSRFPWLVPMAERGEVGRVNAWLTAWLRDNPPYTGPNWKCGQEASIRVLNLAYATRLLEPTPALNALVELHLKRIAPTIGYAIGQDNNHGTSEAAALFVGGSMLGNDQWTATGRKWLDERGQALIAPDGSFSQHSTVYHRLMLDTFAYAETWRRERGLEPFEPATYDRLKAATSWLRQMTDPKTGAVPNFGANDGSQLFPLGDARDFRPSVEQADKLFGSDAPASRQYHDGGYTVMRAGGAKAVLTYPRFRHRPSQADALHLDLWLGSRNVIRDAGTYSYADSTWLSYFAGTQAHSTVQFDRRDQMPRVSRFLFGEWLQTDFIEDLTVISQKARFSARYTDWRGASHSRTLMLDPGRLCVFDVVDGFRDRAVLRWRLDDADWRLEGGVLTDGAVTITVRGDSCQGVQLRLTTGEESLQYGEMHEVPVLEATVRQAGRMVTEIVWTSGP